MIDMLGNNRILDKVTTESGTANARTLSLYGVSSLSNLVNFYVLVRASITGQAGTTTIKVNELATGPLKIMKNGILVDPEDNWVAVGQLYMLTYDGTQFIAFPFNEKSDTNSDIKTLIVGPAFINLTTSSTAEEIATALGGADAEQDFINALSGDFNILLNYTGGETEVNTKFPMFNYWNILNEDGTARLDSFIFIYSAPTFNYDANTYNLNMYFAVYLNLDLATNKYTSVAASYNNVIKIAPDTCYTESKELTSLADFSNYSSMYNCFTANFTTIAANDKITLPTADSDKFYLAINEYFIYTTLDINLANNLGDSTKNYSVYVPDKWPNTLPAGDTFLYHIKLIGDKWCWSRAVVSSLPQLG
jgi:hypothetical protein